MRTLNLKRFQQAKNSLRLFGQPAQRKMLTNQVKQSGSHTELSQLPTRPRTSIQNHDTGSASFGQFYFLIGYDQVGDPNHPIGP